MKFLRSSVILLALYANAQQKPNDSGHEFNGTYEQLRPAQKNLIDEWYAEYNQMMGEHLDPAEYSQLPLSTRTTFEAVTHALLTTYLTSKFGQPLGTALDLVKSIEAINGKVPKARGDLQFRMYVLLKPDALTKLKKSSEFYRDHDNTVYHHGYPLNYRQAGGLPSIQFSMSKDATHADIDIDYRSSKFPQALLNGHLTAANSDVRAGTNTQKHVQRWEGLADWWRNLFGLVESEDESKMAAEVAATGDVPPIPRKGADKLPDAVQDFLSSWLVEQKPELAAAYLSPRSYACLEEYGPQAGKEINAGVAPYLAARDMSATNQLIGKPSSLQEAVKASTIDDPNLKLIKQPYGILFALYQVPDGVAAEFECDPERAFDHYDQVRVSGTGAKYGRYFGSAFQLKPKEGKAETVTFLWAKEGRYWKVISWDVEPEDAKTAAAPDTRRRATVAAAHSTPMHAEDDLLDASNQFLRSWLVADNFSLAATYFSPRCYECVSSYLSPGEEEPKTPEQRAAYIRNAITTIGKEVGRVHHLTDAIEPIAPDHDDLKVLAHPEDRAYTLIAVPDSLAETFSCERPTAKHPYEAPSADSQAKTYGKYYVTLFALRTPGDHPATLTFLWMKENGQWKIVSYEIEAP
jgi:hypothetical protein